MKYIGILIGFLLLFTPIYASEISITTSIPTSLIKSPPQALQQLSVASTTELIALTAIKYGIDPKLALLVSWKESHWNTSAVGDYGTSFGMWQIHNPKAKGLTVNQAEDPVFSTNWAMQTMVQDKGCREWSTCPNTGS